MSKIKHEPMVWVGYSNGETTQGKTYLCRLATLYGIKGYSFEDDRGLKDWAGAGCFIKEQLYKRIKRKLNTLGKKLPYSKLGVR